MVGQSIRPGWQPGCSPVCSRPRWRSQVVSRRRKMRSMRHFWPSWLIGMRWLGMLNDWRMARFRGRADLLRSVNSPESRMMMTMSARDMGCRIVSGWVLAVAVCAPVFAGEAPAWNELTGAQQRVLQQVETEWNDFEPERRQRLVAGAERWLQLDPEERAAARARFERWQAMSPAERDDLRNRAERYRALSPEERQLLRENRQRYREMNEARREALRERWQNMSPEERETLRQRRQERRPDIGRPDRPAERPAERPGRPADRPPVQRPVPPRPGARAP
ncbi:MAG: DUF3106 domain-containing protein [Gammaproteobacteria bacterium]|nr:MAG: DUF3106 domain-containing protein [Gammaproteobacteria bacterium]